MSDYHRALGDVGSIRRQLAQSTQFRGYGPATMAGMAAAALGCAALQAALVPDPANHLRAYLSLWIGTAVLASSAAAWQIHRRTRRLHSGLSNEMIRTAIEQFLPAVLCGALVTAVLVRAVPGTCFLLPGLWQLLFGLGVFSSCRFLPRMMLLAGGWYVLCGLVTLSLGDARALAPWTMGVAFGAGQSLVAAILLLCVPNGARHGV